MLSFIAVDPTSIVKSARTVNALSIAAALFICSGTSVLADNMYESGLQSAMNAERQANSAESWRGAGETWLAQAAFVSKVPNHQDWVKDKVDSAKAPLSISVHKRAIACFLKAYELEGSHETPLSRDQSLSLRCLIRAYQSAMRVDPRNADWHYLYGEALCSKGWYKDGNLELSRAIALGGASGSKASALSAHIKPYVAHEVAAEQSLAKYNAKVNAYNAAHYHPSQQGSGDLAARNQAAMTAIYLMNNHK